jgi:glycosyltransferase involved in cell wall biosynthesis
VIPARVSIVTATYNRSQVLRHSIASVVAQRFTDWELVVVGDACTDDTEAVTASFGDPRIRFHNLPRNVGEQSGPNNTGIGLATGELLAFLNHDDLWFSDHLEHLVAGLERTGADLVFPLMANVIPGHPPAMSNFSPSGSYDPRVVVPASGWLFRRQLWTRVGPWRSARQCYQAPSQDWLLRAWKAGARLQMIPVLTAVALPSGYRRGSYTTRDDSEHAAYAARLRHDPWLREQLLLDMALGQASGSEYSLSGFATGSYLRRGAKNIIRAAVARLGIPPAVVSLWLKSRRKGHFIDTLRQVRGLPPLPPERTRST